ERERDSDIYIQKIRERERFRYIHTESLRERGREGAKVQHLVSAILSKLSFIKVSPVFILSPIHLFRQLCFFFNFFSFPLVGFFLFPVCFTGNHRR
ncbi:hypothetical protein Ccrd_025912, partial [Cynara cardunculus var. scolymus]